MTALREQLLSVSRRLSELGLNRGTSGNASVRDGDGFLVTPSGMTVEEMTPRDMVWMSFDGKAQGGRQPSSEWRFHRDILQARPEVGAVIHTHATFATTLACLHREIPPFHYMIAVAGGDTIRCAPYALFGSQALSDAALSALQDRKACLLANHGAVAIGPTLEAAVELAEKVESLARLYWQALQVGEPKILDGAEMDRVLARFVDYGQD